MDEGFLDPDNKLYPKNINISVSFSVLHQHTLGWEKAQAVELSDKKKSGKEITRDVDKINDRRETNASNAAPSWGADAALFPWSAGLQRANTIIGTNTVSDHPQTEADSEAALEGKK